ncbi:putative Prestin [Hypsibius exemplaris]|uniref:Prestin n=1 Tax=Hypsibius exemplaris TaxID=2072580 RepID=A0A1W0WP54_HYPEX|nr:putative Prestin [Hypsibius exemplaris]
MNRGFMVPGRSKRTRKYSVGATYDHPDAKPPSGHIKTIRTTMLVDEENNDYSRQSSPVSSSSALSKAAFVIGADEEDLAFAHGGEPPPPQEPSPSPQPDTLPGSPPPAPWALPVYINAGDLFHLTDASQVTTNILYKRIYGLNKTPKDCLISLFPQFFRLKNYKAQWMLQDFFAGLIVAMIHFTQVFASSMTASMKPHRGLPLLIFPGFVYAFMTTSPHNSLGGMPITAAALSISNINVEQEYYPGGYFRNESRMLTSDETLYIHMRISTGISFVSGMILIIFGILKLGFLSAVLSPTVTEPFTIACFAQSICSQLPSMFGVVTPIRFGYAKTIQDTIFFFTHIQSVSGFETLLSISYAVLLLGFREYLQPVIFHRFKTVVPLEFILYAAGIGLSYAFDFPGVLGFRTVGIYSYGLPKPNIPAIDYGSPLIFGGFVNAIVSYSVTLRSAQTLARKSRDVISPNQELLALGVAHLFGSFFNCGTVAAPVGRGNVNLSMGSRSQLSTIFACIFMGLLIGYAGPAIAHLPVCIISTNIVLFLVMSVTGFAELPRLWRSNKFDACVWVITFAGCIALNVQLGLMLGIGITLLGLIMRSQKPKVRVLGRLKHSGGFVPLKYYEKASELLGIRIIQIQSPLHYANSQYLIQHISAIAVEPFVGSPASLGLDGGSTSSLNTLGLSRNESLLGVLSKKDTIVRGLRSHWSGSVSNLAASNSEVARRSERHLQQRHLDANNDSRAVSPSIISQEFILMADRERGTASRIVLDLGTVGYIDAVGIRALEQLASDLKLKAIELLLAQCKGTLLKQLKELAIHKIIPERNIFPSVVDAVEEALRRIRINTQPAEGLIGEYEDERFWDMPVVPVEGLPVINYDID